MKPTSEQKQRWDAWASEDGDAWDRKELGADAAHAERAPAELAARINESLRRNRMVAIRLPESLIALRAALAPPHPTAYQLHTRPVRQNPQRLYKLDRLAQLHEVEHVTAGVAPEAFEKLTIGIEGERRRLFTMKRAQPDQPAALAL